MKSAVQFCTLFVTLAFFSCVEENNNKRPACLDSVMDYSSSSVPQDIENSTQLLIKMKDLKSDYRDLKRDLVNAQNDIRIFGVNSSTLLVEVAVGSPARKVLKDYVDDQRIEYIESEHQNRLLNPGQSSETIEAIGEALEEINQDSFSAVEKEIVVAVIDSGVDYTHKDLAPYMWTNSREIAGNQVDDDNNGYVDDVRGWDFANNDSNPMADDVRSYHGTHVAGIVKTASRVAELGIKLKIMPLKYLDSTGTGRSANAVRAVDYASQNGAHLINTSWGSSNFSQALFDAIERARKADVLLIAAAGNGDSYGNGIDIDTKPFYPAAYNHSNVIAVAAHDSNNELAPWSNFGLTRVDLAAPGVQIRSARNGDTYGILSGTSMASPYVAGVAGLLRAVRPDLNYLEIRDVVLKTTIKSSALTNSVATGGRISRAEAIELARTYNHEPGDPVVPDFTPMECPVLAAPPQG